MRTENNWFPTYTGVKFHPTDPRLEDICIEDIAHALSMQCRYAGHVRWFYSIAQHSVLVSRNVPSHLALAGLLHDAAEAYCQDLIRPIKHLYEMRHYREIENRLESVIAEKFNLGDSLWAKEIKEHDNRALMTERRDLYLPGVGAKFDWGVSESPYPEEITPWACGRAEYEFMRRFKELTGGF